MNRKQLWAEFLGTIGIILPPVLYGSMGGNPGLVGGALISGLAVLAMVILFGPISAAHLNPAVTLGFAAAGRFPWRRVPSYIGAQLAGSVAAAVLAAVMVHPGIGAPMPAFLADWGRNIVTESTVTFFLMLVIMAVATVRGGELTTAALGVGFAVVVGVLAAAPISGAAMNPARAFGPALLTGGNALVALPLYFVGPILGAVLAARVYESLRLHPEDGQSAPRESGEGSV